MNNQDHLELLQQGAWLAMKEGTAAVPLLLLKYYRKMQLTEAEVMLIIHLVAFKEKEQKEFPAMEEIQSRMSVAPEQVLQIVQKLLKTEWINIDEYIDPLSGVQAERYNLDNLYQRLALCCVMEQEDEPSAAVAAVNPISSTTQAQAPNAKAKVSHSNKQGKDIFSVFETEFARPLSPMECETIAGWLDQDQYPEELIFAALREAVFAGKLHFRYIDRILLEWSRNRVYTLEQAKEYAKQFRGMR